MGLINLHVSGFGDMGQAVVSFGGLCPDLACPAGKGKAAANGAAVTEKWGYTPVLVVICAGHNFDKQ